MSRIQFVILCICFAIPSFAQDVSVDKKLGAESAVLVEKEMGYYQHDSLYRLINAVGNKLVSKLKQNPFEFKFFLVDAQEPNAFALPGGYVYITRGILPLIQSEDELAGIMAHEIIHVVERHSVKQMRKDRVGAILMVPGKVINAVTGTGLGNILNVPLGLGSRAFISSYSRGHEKDADTYGIQLAASAGYKPLALADALERLAKGIELLTGVKEKRDYFSDHPLTSKRLTEIREAAPTFKTVASPSITGSNEVFLRTFNGLCFGANPKQGVFTDDIFTHPDLGFSWSVPPNWKTINKPAGVGVFPEAGDAVIVLSQVTSEKDVREIGQQVKENARRSRDVTVEFGKDTVMSSNSAYLLRLRGTPPNEHQFMELLWIEFDSSVYQVAGVFQASKMGTVGKSIRSLRKASADELNKIRELKLELVQSTQGETIRQLSERTNNELDPAMTSLINGIDLDKPLGDMRVKVVRTFPYSSQ